MRHWRQLITVCCLRRGREALRWEMLVCHPVVSCSCDFPWMQFWTISSLASWCQSLQKAEVPLRFCLYFPTASPTSESPAYYLSWALCYPRILLWRLVFLFQLSHSFPKSFSSRGGVKGLSFDDLVDFSLGETCKISFQNILNGSLGGFKCNGKIRDSWGKDFQEICTEKILKLFKMQRCLPKWPYTWLFLPRSSGSSDFELTAVGKCRIIQATEQSE